MKLIYPEWHQLELPFPEWQVTCEWSGKMYRPEYITVTILPDINSPVARESNLEEWDPQF